MKVLIIAAHGSRKKESALEVAALAQKLDRDGVPGFDRVVHGFLQFSDPLLPAVIEKAADDGAGTIIVFPFFISAGSHILTDLPELVDEMARSHPQVRFSMTRHLGAIETILDCIRMEADGHLASLGAQD